MWPPSETRAQHLKTITQRAGAPCPCLEARARSAQVPEARARSQQVPEHPEQTSAQVSQHDDAAQPAAGARR